MRKASPELERFIDESIKLSSAKGYYPSVFISMRDRHKTLGAISRLVRSGDIQSGFKRLSELDMLDWTIEAAIQKFPSEFDHHDRACAEYRLSQVRETKD